MSYNVFLHPAVVKFLRKLPKDDVERIKSKLAELTDPYSVKAVKLKSKDAFRIRVGSYRNPLHYRRYQEGRCCV